ncbi:MAG: murein tripeptide amidase MpaA [Verrucomicrobiales bacterium]|nr:murein tripeptide amidase MpaA [Verrucomicrobiales bacterium]
MKQSRLNHRFETLGHSVLGAPITWIPAKEDCELLVIAGIHGEEPETTISVSRALRSLPGLHDSIGIILCANPDGLALGTRGNAHGVDLNRNFPTANWQEHPTTCRWHYDENLAIPILTGSGPGSEPETKILVNAIQRSKPFVILSLHGPLGCIDDPVLSKEGRWLEKVTGLPLVADIGYSTPGSMGTWADENGIDIITWEFPCHSIEQLSRSQVPVLMEIFRGNSPFTSR